MIARAKEVPNPPYSCKAIWPEPTIEDVFHFRMLLLAFAIQPLPSQALRLRYYRYILNKCFSAVNPRITGGGLMNIKDKRVKVVSVFSVFSNANIFLFIRTFSIISIASQFIIRTFNVFFFLSNRISIVFHAVDREWFFGMHTTQSNLSEITRGKGREWNQPSIKDGATTEREDEDSWMQRSPVIY